MTQEYKISAKDKKIGRLATEVVVLLMGKNDVNYAPNKVADVKVVINDINDMDVPEKKLMSKIYDHYSGYPGGRKEITMQKLVEKKGFGEVIKNAIYGMLPKNKLRDVVMKNLIINE